jgi:hypothetical protein
LFNRGIQTSNFPEETTSCFCQRQTKRQIGFRYVRPIISFPTSLDPTRHILHYFFFFLSENGGFQHHSTPLDHLRRVCSAAGRHGQQYTQLSIAIIDSPRPLSELPRISRIHDFYMFPLTIGDTCKNRVGECPLFTYSPHPPFETSRPS